MTAVTKKNKSIGVIEKFTFLTNNILKEPYPLPIIVIPKQRRIGNDRYLQPGMLEMVNHGVIHG